MCQTHGIWTNVWPLGAARGLSKTHTMLVNTIKYSDIKQPDHKDRIVKWFMLLLRGVMPEDDPIRADKMRDFLGDYNPTIYVFGEWESFSFGALELRALIVQYDELYL